MHNGETINQLTALVAKIEKLKTCACCEARCECNYTSDSMPGLDFCSAECRNFTEQEALDARDASGLEWN